MIKMNDLIEMLNKKEVPYTKHEHEALFSVEDSKGKRGIIEGAHTKNLFLKNKKDNFFLLTCEESENLNLKNISKSLGLGNVSFAKEVYLEKFLGIKPGSVSPFALLNDIENVVSFYLEEKLNDNKFINFHPLINDATITMKTSEFIEFMIENNKKIHIFSSSKAIIVKSYE